jgi:SOS-response transcriptional repressor LexA
MQMSSTAIKLGMFLRVLRIRAGLDQAQLALLLGVTQPTISRWELGGTRPEARHLEGWLTACRGALSAERLRAARELLAMPGREAAPEESGLARELERLTAELINQGPLLSEVLIPLFADVAAGVGESQEQLSEPRCSLAVPRSLFARDPQCYALRVSGDSMAPQLLDGDLVVVSPAAPLVDGCIVAAFVEPDGDVIKVYRSLPDGAVLLQPANSSYPAILLKPNGGREARIWGRVVLQQREL